jgi:sulfatase maturation enzyme AslB (radical SAM superfamily)
MYSTTLKKILEWAIYINREPKKIVLTGGEPTSRFELIKMAGEYVLTNDINKKIEFDDVPTNATLLTKEMIKTAKDLNLKFAFSLDGYNFSSNKFRYSSKSLYKTILNNLDAYINETKTIPRIKMTVNPKNSNLLYENVKSLLLNGLTVIQILPAFGPAWDEKSKVNFLNNFDHLLKLHYYLKVRKNKISIDPIDWYIRMIQKSDFGIITHNNCDMGEQISFTPSGDAYACLSMIHLKGNKKLRDRFYLGSIFDKIDTQKMYSLKSYRICTDLNNLHCKYHFPNIVCKKICSTIDFKSGRRLAKSYIMNLNEIENSMFDKVYKFYFKSKN